MFKKDYRYPNTDVGRGSNPLSQNRLFIIAHTQVILLQVMAEKLDSYFKDFMASGNHFNDAIFQCYFTTFSSLFHSYLTPGGCLAIPDHVTTNTDLPVEIGKVVMITCTRDLHKLSGDKVITCGSHGDFEYNTYPTCNVKAGMYFIYLFRFLLNSLSDVLDEY